MLATFCRFLPCLCAATCPVDHIFGKGVRDNVLYDPETDQAGVKMGGEVSWLLSGLCAVAQRACAQRARVMRGKSLRVVRACRQLGCGVGLTRVQICELEYVNAFMFHMKNWEDVRVDGSVAVPHFEEVGPYNFTREKW